VDSTGSPAPAGITDGATEDATEATADEALGVGATVAGAVMLGAVGAVVVGVACPQPARIATRVMAIVAMIVDLVRGTTRWTACPLVDMVRLRWSTAAGQPLVADQWSDRRPFNAH